MGVLLSGTSCNRNYDLRNPDRSQLQGNPDDVPCSNGGIFAFADGTTMVLNFNSMASSRIPIVSNNNHLVKPPGEPRLWVVCIWGQRNSVSIDFVLFHQKVSQCRLLINYLRFAILSHKSHIKSNESCNGIVVTLAQATPSCQKLHYHHKSDFKNWHGSILIWKEDIISGPGMHILGLCLLVGSDKGECSAWKCPLLGIKHKLKQQLCMFLAYPDSFRVMSIDDLEADYFQETKSFYKGEIISPKGEL